ncbi:hypothetical protein CO015_01785 [candidate division WWE3 bacterium CG_4_8_14_3_um_filter_42_11]|uniref:Addiction module toxin, HicA family n=1 Tax=candidate division WWE3 bacterium CG_4_8_14_3_um_filter_42_11 TaxID=1975076 RepID=A0A2M8G7E2_UNCKA|nr:MAG: hypothetical protein CO015_01785 [candidate division WWE3 bacterium CG_4_8_14_3_um_filter_42_11]
MSTKLPVVKSKQVLKALLKANFKLVRQKGSHADLHHPDCRRTIVPIHTVDISKGTLRVILRQTEISIQEFTDLL